MSNVWSDEDVEAFDVFGDEESDEDYLDSDTETDDVAYEDDAEARAATRRRRRARARRLAWRRELARRRTALPESFDGEVYGEDFEAMSPAMRRRRANSQRARLARKRKLQRLRATRAATARSGRPRSPGSKLASTRAAVEKVDLESKVQADALKGAVAAQANRTGRAEYATVASAVVNQFQNTFNLIKNPYGKAALSFAPLLLLSPATKGRGAGALARNPVALGGAAIAALAVAGDLNSRKGAVRRVDVLGVSTLTSYSATATFIADALDDKGRPVPNKVPTWTSSDPNIATVDANGTVNRAQNIGTIFITATVDGVVGRALLTVDR